MAVCWCAAAANGRKKNHHLIYNFSYLFDFVDSQLFAPSSMPFLCAASEFTSALARSPAGFDDVLIVCDSF